MKQRTLRFAITCVLAMLSQLTFAQTPGTQTPAESATTQPDTALPQRRFQPPPMPEFMLKPSAQPLSQEEKMRQAEEAAARVRRPQADTPPTQSDEADSQTRK